MKTFMLSCSFFSLWYCPHYERETCLIHFQCCPEGKLYPCHKCHNEANVVIETTSVKDQENDEAHGSSERNTVENTVTSVELATDGFVAGWNNDGDRLENQAEVEEQELFESPSNVVENTDTSAELTTGGSAAEWNNEAEQPDNSGPTGNCDAALKKRGCKDVKDLKSLPRSIHLEATASDGTFLQCRECGHQQEVCDCYLQN